MAEGKDEKVFLERFDWGMTIDEIAYEMSMSQVQGLEVLWRAIFQILNHLQLGEAPIGVPPGPTEIFIRMMLDEGAMPVDVFWALLSLDYVRQGGAKADLLRPMLGEILTLGDYVAYTAKLGHPSSRLMSQHLVRTSECNHCGAKPKQQCVNDQLVPLEANHQTRIGDSLRFWVESFRGEHL